MNPCLAWITSGVVEDPRVGHRCMKPDAEKAMAFRGTDWCCENHRKLVVQQDLPALADGGEPQGDPDDDHGAGRDGHLHQEVNPVG